MISKSQQDIIIQKIEPYKPISIGIFGSYARNENKPDSDLDILVSFGPKITLSDILGIEQELTEILGLAVYLVTEKSLSKKNESQVHKDLIYIYKA